MTLTPTRAAPTDNLLRTIAEPAELRTASDGQGRILHGHFAVFNELTEIDSLREGHFMERMAPGAFASAVRDVDKIKVLFDHGKDPQMGNKPLGKITSLREDARGIAYEVRLLKAWETDAPWLIEAARDGLLGASMRFGIDDETWNIPRSATADNPKRLKERTVLKAYVREFGPVTFPAYAGATAMIRSTTDEYFDDPLFVARMTDRLGLTITERILISLRSDPVSDVVDETLNEEGAPTVPDEAVPDSEGALEEVTPEAEALDVEVPDQGDRAADGPYATRTFTHAERQHHHRQILARQAGLGGTQ